MRSQGPRSFNQGIALQILRRDKFVCTYCGDIASEADHVVPYSKGGPTIKQNGVACCKSCNMKKKGRLSEEYLVKGLVHLAKVGEDINWVDKLYTNEIDKNTRATGKSCQIVATVSAITLRNQLRV